MAEYWPPVMLSRSILMDSIASSFKLTELGMRGKLRLELRLKGVERKRKAEDAAAGGQSSKKSALGDSN